MLSEPEAYEILADGSHLWQSLPNSEMHLKRTFGLKAQTSMN